jgi:hypothetical protein
MAGIVTTARWQKRKRMDLKKEEGRTGRSEGDRYFGAPLGPWVIPFGKIESSLVDFQCFGSGNSLPLTDFFTPFFSGTAVVCHLFAPCWRAFH